METCRRFFCNGQFGNLNFEWTKLKIFFFYSFEDGRSCCSVMRIRNLVHKGPICYLNVAVQLIANTLLKGVVEGCEDEVLTDMKRILLVYDKEDDEESIDTLCVLEVRPM